MNQETGRQGDDHDPLTDVGEVVNPLLARVLDGELLSSAETERAFDLLFEKDESGFYWAALSTALHARGESPEELAGICESIESLLDAFSAPIAGLDFNGTGRRTYPTINVGTCASFVAAAAGVDVAKHGSGSVTGSLGSMDLAGTFGLDRSWPMDGARIAEDLELDGVVFIHNFLRSGRAHTRQRYLNTLRTVGLRMTSPFHIVGGIPQVVQTRARVFGSFSVAYHQQLAPLMMKRYSSFVLVTGSDGLDEVSVSAESTLTFRRQVGEPETIVVSPTDLGLPHRPWEELVVERPEDRVTQFVRVLAGADRGALSDLVVANAGLGLWIAGAAASIGDGVVQASEALSTRTPWKTFSAAAARAGRADQLRVVCRRANVPTELS